MYKRQESLEPVPAKPTSVDVRSTLLLIDSADPRQGDVGDPAFARLLAIGERDLGSLISELGRSGYRSQRGLTEAIATLADEGQRDRIVVSLEDRVQLADVVLACGWEQDARDALVATLRARRPLTTDGIRAAVLLGDESLYPYLLEQFDHQPSTEVFDLLWQIPELRKPVEEIVRRRWARMRSAMHLRESLHFPELHLALRIGELGALKAALAAYRGGDIHEAERALRPVMMLPRRQEQVAEALAGLTAGDFTWDPQRRVFEAKGTTNRGGEKS